MKTIYHINLTFYLGYLLAILMTFIEGKDANNLAGFLMLGPILLGITQPLSAFILLILVDSSEKLKIKYLNYYFLGIVIFFLSISIIDYFHLDYKIILYVIGSIPMLLATYFIFITYKFQEQ